MTNHKTRVTLIALILAVVATSLFLVVREVTALFSIAYGFTLLGIAAFWWSGMSLVGNVESYPWGMAFPITTYRYLSVELVFSAEIDEVTVLSDSRSRHGAISHSPSQAVD
jgi:hypothetical protein